MRPGETSLVFNRFWRADPARARTTGGTGLGLPISLEDARLHNGWLQAWGEPGDGTNFRLTLPLHAGGEIVGVTAAAGAGWIDESRPSVPWLAQPHAPRAGSAVDDV